MSYLLSCNKPPNFVCLNNILLLMILWVDWTVLLLHVVQFGVTYMAVFRQQVGWTGWSKRALTFPKPLVLGIGCGALVLHQKAPGFMWCFLSTSSFSPAEQPGLPYYMTRFQEREVEAARPFKTRPQTHKASLPLQAVYGGK